MSEVIHITNPVPHMSIPNTSVYCMTIYTAAPIPRPHLLHEDDLSSLWYRLKIRPQARDSLRT